MSMGMAMPVAVAVSVVVVEDAVSGVCITSTNVGGNDVKSTSYISVL